MPSKPPRRPDGALDLDLPEQPRDRVEYVGPSMQGWIYRSTQPNRPAVYRILPVRDNAAPCLDDAQITRRHEIRAWAGPKRPRQPGLAPILQAEPCSLGGRPYFVVRYEVDKDWSLVDALKSAERGVRLDFARRALEALPSWWERLHAGLLPLPADVFYAEDQPWLLQLPLRQDCHLPDAEVVLAEPERAWYLAPELVRGQMSRVSGYNLDMYALGVSLWQCFYRLPAARPGPADSPLQVLCQVVHGLDLHPPSNAWDMPFWLERLPNTREVVAQIRNLLSADLAVRERHGPRPVAEYLAKRRAGLDPLLAVQGLLDGNEPVKAHDLLQDILLDRDSYEFLLLGANISGQYLHRPLEAGELYEKAIAKDPSQVEAYRLQLTALLKGFRTLLDVIQRLTARGLDVAELTNALTQLDARIQRDFDRLPPQLQEGQEESVARYYVGRGQLDKAMRFIYPRLVNGQPGVWWKFGLARVYAEAYRDLARADRQHLPAALKQVRFTQFKIHEAATAGPGETALDTLRDYNRIFEQLEQELLRMDPRGGST